jgi:hypothetical protein
LSPNNILAKSPNNILATLVLVRLVLKGEGMALLLKLNGMARTS